MNPRELLEEVGIEIIEETTKDLTFKVKGKKCVFEFESKRYYGDFYDGKFLGGIGIKNLVKKIKRINQAK